MSENEPEGHLPVVDAKKSVTNFRALLDLTGVIKDNLRSYFEIRDFLSIRSEIAKLRDLLGRAHVLSNRQAVTVLQHKSYDQVRIKSDLDYDLGEIQAFCEETLRFLNERCSFLKEKNPELYRKLREAFADRLICFDLSRSEPFEDEWENLFELSDIYGDLHEALDQLIKELSQEIDRMKKP